MKRKRSKTPPNRRQLIKAGGIYYHGPECECKWCRDPVPTKYARAKDTSTPKGAA